jgi:hypothetical protein
MGCGASAEARQPYEPAQAAPPDAMHTQQDAQDAVVAPSSSVYTVRVVGPCMSGNIYVGVMCPVFSSARARVNACARTRQQGVSLLGNLSGESPSFV